LRAMLAAVVGHLRAMRARCAEEMLTFLGVRL
jgi:hypothetical protein